MIKSISYWSFRGGLENSVPIHDALQQAEAAGFEGIELAIAADGVLTLDSGAEQLAEVRSAIDASSLTIETLASGFTWGLNPLDDDAAKRNEAGSQHARALRIAGELGLQDYLFVPGVVKSPISDSMVRYDRAVSRLRETIDQLLPIAEKARVGICLENVWNGLFYSPLELCAFIDSFKSDWLGIYFDVGNVLGYHQHPPHWIELLGSRIRRVHIKDYKESVGGLAGFCDLLEGDVPWEESMAALRAIGYDKTVVAEMIPWNEGLLERTSRAMDAILGK